jgi:hypothetical protein
MDVGMIPSSIERLIRTSTIRRVRCMTEWSCEMWQRRDRTAGAGLFRAPRSPICNNIRV